MDGLRCACFERHYINTQGAMTMTFHDSANLVNGTTTLYTPRLTYWRSREVNQLSIQGGYQINGPSGTYTFDLSSSIPNFAPFEAADIGRVSDGFAGYYYDDITVTTQVRVTLTVLTATTARITLFGDGGVSIGNFRIDIAWNSERTRESF